MEARKVIEQVKIVPVVKIDNVSDTMPLMNALCEGGIPIAEITAPEKASENPPVAFFGFSTLWGTHMFLK